MVDAALNLGNNAVMSTEQLFATGRLAELGSATILSASNKGLFGEITGAEVGVCSNATHNAHVIGIMQGASDDAQGVPRMAGTESELLHGRGIAAPAAVAV